MSGVLRRGFVLALLLGGLAAAGPSAAEEESAAARGRRLAQAGRCAEALPWLARARALEPEDRVSGVAEAQCRLQRRDYAGARALLDRLRANGAGSSEVDLYLAIAAYHQGEREVARAALARSLAEGPERAETRLYAGILAFEDGVHDAAVDSLERARSLDADTVEPMASYYAGVARLRLGRSREARRDLERVLAHEPNGAWADPARTLLGRLEQRPTPRAWRIELTAGVESDDNVVLRGDDVTLPEDISDEGDERLMWRVKASSSLARGNAGILGLSGDYSGTLHRELGDFDVHYPALALWWQRALGESSASRVEYRIGHAWVNGEAFVVTHSFGPTFLRDWKRAGRSLLRARVFAFDYRDGSSDIPDGAGAAGDPCPTTTSACGPPGVDESETRDRSGVGYELFGEQRWSLPIGERALELRPGLRFQQYFAGGDEASFLRLEPRLALSLELPFELVARADAGWAWRPYAGGHSLPELGTAVAGRQFQPVGRKRLDRALRLGAGLERRFFERVTAEARYSFLDNASNLRAADYERHVAGVYFTVQLGP